MKECPRFTFLFFFSLHILIIAISFNNVFLDHVTLILCFKIVTVEFLLNEFWLQIMTKILFSFFFFGLVHISKILNSCFPLIYFLLCHSTAAPLLRLDSYSAL